MPRAKFGWIGKSSSAGSLDERSAEFPYLCATRFDGPARAQFGRLQPKCRARRDPRQLLNPWRLGGTYFTERRFCASCGIGPTTTHHNGKGQAECRSRPLSSRSSSRSFWPSNCVFRISGALNPSRTFHSEVFAPDIQWVNTACSIHQPTLWLVLWLRRPRRQVDKLEDWR
jgi:hypothetical protein